MTTNNVLLIAGILVFLAIQLWAFARPEWDQMEDRLYAWLGKRKSTTYAFLALAAVIVALGFWTVGSAIIETGYNIVAIVDYMRGKP